MPILKYEEAKITQIGDNLERRIANLDTILTAIIDFSNGPMEEPDPPHSHPHEQISYVAKGELYVFLGEDKYHIKEGDLFAVPSGIPHTIQTLTPEVRLIDTFSPVRKDFITQ